MSCQRGDIVLIAHRPPISGAGREAKTRPMVIVSSDAYHSERPQDVLAALITTKVDKYTGTTDYALEDWAAAGLRQASVVRATVATIEQSQIGARVGRLTTRDLTGVDAALRRALDLSDQH